MPRALQIKPGCSFSAMYTSKLSYLHATFTVRPAPQFGLLLFPLWAYRDAHGRARALTTFWVITEKWLLSHTQVPLSGDELVNRSVHHCDHVGHLSLSGGATLRLRCRWGCSGIGDPPRGGGAVGTCRVPPTPTPSQSVKFISTLTRSIFLLVS